ncbi:ATP-grasp domain-containing protein [Streptomyces sp. NBC_00623]|uniref:ATP-grasp domain-containing protein n=1 Tax=Streptomyces sp. NBC_00623 TaxID=2975790 RepID=UPI0030DFFAE9
MARAVLLLGAEGAAAEQLVGAAQTLEIHLHIATHRELYRSCPDELRKQLAGTVFTDFRSTAYAVDQLAEYCAQEGIGGVAVGRETLSPVAAALTDRLGLPGHDPAMAESARGKWQMAQTLRARGVPGPRTLAVVSPEAAEERLRSAGLHYPVVVRPAGGSGSIGLTLVETPDELPGAVRRALKWREDITYGIHFDAVAVIQEHLEGAEYSVETVLHRGGCTHLAIVRRISAGGRNGEELGRTLPADVDELTRITILATVERGLAALGLRDGIAHSHLKMTAEGPRLIEVGAGPPDGPVMEMIEHATGVSEAAAYLQAVLGEPPDTRPTRSGAVAIRFINTPRHGVFRGLSGLAASPHVIAVRSYAEPGDLVGSTHSKYTRLGHVIVLATGPDQADARADEAIAGISSCIES